MSITKADVGAGNIYVYKLVADNGGAPCLHQGRLSLSICKPRIRQVAGVDDWIIGFGGKSVADLRNRLIYIARVTEVKENGDYYKDPQYRKRPDCIYRFIDPGYEYIPGSKYHEPEDLTHDLGAAPHFERARNLVSAPGNFAYFGENSEPSIAEVQHIYDDLPRDFAKNHTDKTREKLEDFIIDVFSRFGTGVHGKPTHFDMTIKCNQSEGEPFTVPRCVR